MWYVFNKDDKCICKCEYCPDEADLATRGEYAIENRVDYENFVLLKYDKVTQTLYLDDDEILKATKESARIEMRNLCAAEITSKIKLNVIGNYLFYGCDRDDQSNLLIALKTTEVTGQPVEIKCYDLSGNKLFVEHTYDQLVAVLNATQQKILNCQKRLKELLVLIDNAKTVAEVGEIKWQ